jgi:flagellar hook-length control protein FliK
VQAAPDAPTVVPATIPGTPSVGSAVSVTPSTPAGSPAPTQQPALTQQLARPLFTLANAGHGQHVVTVTVSPESLGQVTVRAHVSAQGMHVEMFAASDAGRDAVRAILPDLKRDMGQSGVSTTLDLSSQNQPSDTGRQQPDARAATGPATRQDTGLEARPTAPTSTPVRQASGSAGLDVLA